MRWKFVPCVILLACVILQAVLVLPASSSTTISGTVPLAIYDVSASHVGFHTARISWRTNGDATSQVFYDTEFHSNLDDYRYCTREYTALASKHKVRLVRLSSFTTYHYRVKSVAIVDGTGFIAVSDDYTFMTRPWWWRW